MTFYDIEMKSRELREKIRNAKPELHIKGTTYYVSHDGNDENDGLSPNTAWKTLDGPFNNSEKMNPGDAVLFRCGDIFRPTYPRRSGIKLRPGVTYSSFGEGKKPIIYGTAVNGVTLNWKKESDILYSLDIDHQLDIGNIVFDEGKEWGYKKVKGRDEDTTPTLDLDYFHDVSGHKLYLCSEKGEPAKRWKDMHICNCCTILHGVESGVVIDGLTLKYAGAFAISGGTVKYPPNALPYYEGFSDFTVRNCEMEWIGGSIQGDPTKSTTRFGNGFEIWGGGSNLLVENCYFNQCYDAALTQQFSGQMGTNFPVTVENSVFRNNLFENNTYDYEYFLTEFDENRKHKADSGFGFFNVSFENNICRKNGYGFGNQRPARYSPACLKAWGHQNKSKNFVVKNNIFDRADYCLLEIMAGAGEEYAPTLDGNVYCQYENKEWIRKVKGKPASVFNGDTIKNPTANYAEANAITIITRK
ncbi:MAG: hypothetical protein E7526_01960 [Ruminococcaceae bacterium]|nr:hypothetical protein [Oscillospiraceae bacterium]